MKARLHEVDLDEMLDYLRQERWTVYAMSSGQDKSLEVLIGGNGFRVTSRGEVTYRGQNASDAVRAYNEAR